jgi:hypothetical protein
LGSLKKMMAISVLLLLLVLSLSHFIFVRYVKTQKHHFRSQVLKMGVNDVFAYTLIESDLYKDSNGIEWKDEGKELVVNGKYHEIIQISCKNGIATLLLVPDELENKLFSTYFNLRNANPNSLPGTLLHFMGLLFFHGIQAEFNSLKMQMVLFFKGEPPFTLSSYSEKIIKPPMFTALT